MRLLRSVSTLPAAALLICVAAFAPAPALATDEPIPMETKERLGLAIQKRIDALLQEKNADGTPYKRCTASFSYRKADDSTYKTTFFVDTATIDSLKSERYELTLKQAGDGKTWAIADEKLLNTITGISRAVYSQKDFGRFQKFSFNKEGLQVSATNGNVWLVKRDGKAQRIVLTADDLAYQYTPPMPLDQALYANLKKRHGDDVVFKPEQLSIVCDPVSCESILATGFQGTESAPSTTPIGEAELTGVMKRAWQKLYDDDRKEKRDDWFSGFALQWKPEERYWSLTLSTINGNKAVGVVYNNDWAREVYFGVYGLFETFSYWEPVYSYYSEETRNSGADPYQLEMRDSGIARYYELEGLKGTVELGLDEAELLKGDVTFTLNTKLPAKELYFAISRKFDDESIRRQAKNPSMRVKLIEDAEGNELSWVKAGQSSGLIVLPKEVPAGTKIVVRMVFENKNSLYKLNDTYSAMDRGGWLPFVSFTDRIKDFDLTVKVPKRYTTLGVGKVVSDEIVGDARVTRFHPVADVSFPTVIFGDYYPAESKIIVKKPDGSIVPVRIYVDKTGMSDWGITQKSLPALADEAANALNLYGEIFGVPYPYEKLDLVNDPLGFLYGQSPASIIYLGSGGFWSKGTLGSIGGGDLTQFSKSLVAHETAHQWWGSLISNANDWNYWFVESLAEYSAALFVENVHSKKEYDEHVEEWRRRVIESDLEGSVVGAGNVWGGTNPNPGISYRELVYSKGPYIFHVMRTTWGDEKFFKFLKDLATSLAGKPIVTRDIQKVAEKSYGFSMEWFFDQWLRGVGTPEYTLKYKTRLAENGKWVMQGSIDQRIVTGPKKDVVPGYYYTAVVPFIMTGVSGKTYRVPVKVEGKATTQILIPLPEEPRSIVFVKSAGSLGYDAIVAN